jgi:hypothetical protein
MFFLLSVNTLPSSTILPAILPTSNRQILGHVIMDPRQADIVREMTPNFDLRTTPTLMKYLDNH